MKKIIFILLINMCFFLLNITYGEEVVYSATNNHGCVLSVAMCKKQYYLLEPIKFKILIHNIDKGEVVFEERFFKNFSIEILDKNKDKVTLTKQGRLMHSGLFMGSGKYEHIFLESNTTKEFIIFLNLLFDLSNQGYYDVVINFEYGKMRKGKITPENISLRLPVRIIVPNPNDVNLNIIQSQINCLSFDKKKKLYQHLNQYFLVNIDSNIVCNAQTNYPCFEALKKNGVPFKTFTNELQNVESGSKKEELFLDLGNNLYGEIFQLYLEQKKQD